MSEFVCACVSFCSLCQKLFVFFSPVGKKLFSLLLSEEHVDIWETDKFVCIPPPSSPLLFFYTLDQACTEEIHKLLA